MFNLLSALELQALSETKLLHMIVNLSNAIRETKSMQDTESAGQKLYRSLVAEHERRKMNVDGIKEASV